MFYVADSMKIWGDNFNPKLLNDRQLEKLCDEALRAYNKAFAPPPGGLSGIAAVVIVACAVVAICCTGGAAAPAVGSVVTSSGGTAAAAASTTAAATAAAPAVAASVAPVAAATGASSGLAATAAAIGSGAMKTVIMGAVDRELNKRGAPKRDAQTEAAISELTDRYSEKFAKAAKQQEAKKTGVVALGAAVLGGAALAFM